MPFRVLLLVASFIIACTLNALEIDVKPIYDATKYRAKPQRLADTFPPITVLYVNQLLGKKYTIDLVKLRQVASTLPPTEVPYILDIEIWDVHIEDDNEANENIDKYILVIDTMKKARPDLKFGYYGVLPNRDYWAPVSSDPEKLALWNRINKRLKRLAEYVDVVCPSLYTFYDDLENWKQYALENIKRARQYGKPVYPFLWPEYHNSNKHLRGQFIAGAVWGEQLAYVYEYADGIIVWGGWNLSKEYYGPKLWNENASWWRVTKAFLRDRQQ